MQRRDLLSALAQTEGFGSVSGDFVPVVKAAPKVAMKETLRREEGSEPG
jgi:hypothetical protein